MFLNKVKELNSYLNKFKVRPVLTAHPTQFYPGTVLGIITDLDIAIQKSDLLTIKKLLAQLGKTPFFKKEKPSPYDEAIRLIWYLENVFYHSVSKIYDYIQHNILKDKEIYVGLEDSKKTWKLCVRSNRVVIHDITMPAKYIHLRNYFHNRFPSCRITVLYEAGFKGCINFTAG